MSARFAVITYSEKWIQADVFTLGLRSSAEKAASHEATAAVGSPMARYAVARTP